MRGKMNTLFYLLVYFIFCLVKVEAHNISGYCYDSISEVGKYSDSSLVPNIHNSGKYLYLFTPDKGIIQLKMTNSTTPVVTAIDSTHKTVEAMRDSGNYLYTAAGSSGFLVFDESVLGTIKELATVTTSGWASDIAISGKYAFLADGPDGLRVYDISNPSSPTEKYHLELAGYASRIKIHDNYAYIAEANCGLGIIDISNPSQPVQVSQFMDTTPVLDISFSQNSCLALATGNNGVIICSLSGNTEISILNRQSLSGYARRVLWSGEYIYVSDYLGGLQILETRMPGYESVVVDVQNHCSAMDCEATENYLYLASGTDGLNILTKPVPLENVEMILSLHSNQTTYTDSNGFYYFTNLPIGTYNVAPVRGPDYFYPSGQYITCVCEDNPGINFKRSMWKWGSDSGLFTDSDMTSNWAYELCSGCSSMPEVNWASYVEGWDGSLAVKFTQANQGIKLTAKPRIDFINSLNRIGSVHYRISSDSHLLLDSFKYTLMGFDGWTSYNYREILSNQYDVKTAVDLAWMDFWLPFREQCDNGILQLELKNKSATGTVYIDAVDINKSMLFQEDSYKTLPGGDFSSFSSLDYWNIESLSSATAGLPEISWAAQSDGQMGVLLLRFTQAGKGVKLTLNNPYTISTTAESTQGGFMFSLQLKSSATPDMLVHALHYGEAAGTGSGYSNDTAEYYNLGKMTPGSWQTYYVPLVSSGSLKRHFEIEFLYSGTEPVDLYLDNVRWIPAELSIE